MRTVFRIGTLLMNSSPAKRMAAAALVYTSNHARSKTPGRPLEHDNLCTLNSKKQYQNGTRSVSSGTGARRARSRTGARRVSVGTGARRATLERGRRAHAGTGARRSHAGTGTGRAHASSGQGEPMLERSKSRARRIGNASLELDPALVDHGRACRQRTAGDETAHLNIALMIAR